MTALKVLFAASEIVPFAKTGGLADVAGILPLEIASLGHRVIVFLPYYRQVRNSGLQIKLIKDELTASLGNSEINFSLYHCKGEAVDFYLVKKDEYFDREFLYGTSQEDYPDNALRFAFFAQAVLTSAIALNFKPDIVHCNDWQCALIPFYLKFQFKEHKLFKQTKTIFTIHNLAYQGVFPKEVMLNIEINDRFFTPEGLEFYGKLSFMKSGILYSDAINTVSKGYAREILNKEFGCGLEGLLNTRKDDLYGILNGADYTQWNPKTDRFIKINYNQNSLQNKVKCKKELLAQMKLPQSLDAPFLGVVTRLAEQKGIDIICAAIPEIVKLGCKLIVLGIGDEKYHRLLTALAKKYRKNLTVKIAFDNSLAHKIEAGCDMFLMPSRYEPCGLNQMYSFKYGTIPVVRAVGGLDDTVIDYTRDHKNGNGFKFKEATCADFMASLKQALRVYQNQSEWKRLIQRVMGLDFSWRHSAQQYLKIYRKIISP